MWEWEQNFDTFLISVNRCLMLARMVSHFWSNETCLSIPKRISEQFNINLYSFRLVSNYALVGTEKSSFFKCTQALCTSNIDHRDLSVRLCFSATLALLWMKHLSIRTQKQVLQTKTCFLFSAILKIFSENHSSHLSTSLAISAHWNAKCWRTFFKSIFFWDSQCQWLPSDTTWQAPTPPMMTSCLCSSSLAAGNYFNIWLLAAIFFFFFFFFFFKL
jgi:hypothetical protein